MDKDKYMYHASNVKGIKELVPRVSSHGKSYVYASDNLVLALLFGAKKDDFDLLMDLSQGQVVVWNATSMPLRIYMLINLVLYTGLMLNILKVRRLIGKANMFQRIEFLLFLKKKFPIFTWS